MSEIQRSIGGPSDDGDPKTTFGWIFCVGSAMAALPVGVIAGGLNKLNGGSFEKGLSSTVDAIANYCADVGDKYNDTIVKGLLGGAAGAVAVAAVNEVIKPESKPPST